jgi:inosose dehydratase
MRTHRPVVDRLAGAPISWGVSEAPDWGYELPPDRVLAEMAGLGLKATELGPTGYLGASSQAVREQLHSHGLRLVGGFVPVAMHIEPDVNLDAALAAMRTLADAGAEVVVLAGQSVDGSYDRTVVMTDREWPVFLATLGRLQKISADLGLTCTLHPHAGTTVADRESVLRLVDSSDVLLCLDTGHLVIGGMQPAELLDRAAERVAHVHLKDVRLPVAEVVAPGTSSYIEAVRAGLYAPLGQGDLDIAGVVAALERAGYQGWYVLEQDAALVGEPAPGTGPVEAVRASIDFVTAAVA